MQLFGWLIKRADEPDPNKLQAIAPPVEDDGALVIQSGGNYGTYVDLEGSAKTEAELVLKYREMAMHPEVDAAVDDIVNESIVVEKNEKTVEINLDDVPDLPERIKKLVVEEFEEVLSLLDFNEKNYDLFRRWYVDGRLYFQAIIDVTKPEDGIAELRYLDPRKIRKIRQIKQTKEQIGQGQGAGALEKTEIVQEFFLYNDKGFAQKASTSGVQGTQATGVRIAKDSVLHVTSGVLDPASTVVVSHLHKAIKPLNQLRAIEDASVIYRLARAPERRVFNIDVGNLPKMKAEQYMRDVMQRYKNKIVYDASTGEIRDDRKFMTMLEDFWLPKREGKGTTIDTLPGGENLGNITDIEYFLKKLYKSLNVPESRLEQESIFQLGNASEVNRDEVKFSKFIDRLRSRFNHVFLGALGKQLVLKGVMTSMEWDAIVQNVKFDYARDNFYAELKDTQILATRAQTMQLLDPYVGIYFSRDWVNRKVWHMTDDEIEEQQEKILEEMENPIYQQSMGLEPAPMGGEEQDGVSPDKPSDGTSGGPPPAADGPKGTMKGPTPGGKKPQQGPGKMQKPQAKPGAK